MAVPLHLPPLFTTREALALGVGERALAGLVRRGSIIRERPGLYFTNAAWCASDPIQRHVAVARKVAYTLHGELVLAGVSAAALHGMSTPQPWTDRGLPITLYTLDHQNAHQRANLRVIAAPLLPGEVVPVDGLRATSIPRTALDLARHQDLAHALIPIDAALRLGATRASLQHMADRMYRWPGSSVLRRALPFASALAESALESWSRGTFAARGIAAPALQPWLTGASGRRYRVDMFWPTARVVGEADGWGKHGDSADDWRLSLQRQQLRQDDLADAGFRVVRWTWSTIDAAAAVIMRCLAQADARTH